MTTISAVLRTIPGTEAAEATTGGRSVVVDRPAGVAGGTGAGFNGGQLLALAIGGCLANDLRYVAHARGVTLGEFELRVDVEVEEGRVTGVDVGVRGVEDPELLEAAVAGSTIVGAVVEGVAVRVHPA